MAEKAVKLVGFLGKKAEFEAAMASYGTAAEKQAVLNLWLNHKDPEKKAIAEAYQNAPVAARPVDTALRDEMQSWGESVSQQKSIWAEQTARASLQSKGVYDPTPAQLDEEARVLRFQAGRTKLGLMDDGRLETVALSPGQEAVKDMIDKAQRTQRASAYDAMRTHAKVVPTNDVYGPEVITSKGKTFVVPRAGAATVTTKLGPTYDEVQAARRQMLDQFLANPDPRIAARGPTLRQQMEDGMARAQAERATSEQVAAMRQRVADLQAKIGGGADELVQAQAQKVYKDTFLKHLQESAPIPGDAKDVLRMGRAHRAAVAELEARGLPVTEAAAAKAAGGVKTAATVAGDVAAAAGVVPQKVLAKGDSMVQRVVAAVRGKAVPAAAETAAAAGAETAAAAGATEGAIAKTVGAVAKAPKLGFLGALGEIAVPLGIAFTAKQLLMDPIVEHIRKTRADLAQGVLESRDDAATNAMESEQYGIQRMLTRIGDFQDRNDVTTQRVLAHTANLISPREQQMLAQAGVPYQPAPWEGYQ